MSKKNQMELFAPNNYDRMCVAISTCDRVDDCKSIADKSVAMAAYYKQIRDEESVLALNRIRLRAWRRLAALLIGARVIPTDITQKAMIVTVRKLHLNDKTVEAITDSRMLELIKLHRLSDYDFESALACKVNGSIGNLITQTPSHIRQVRENWKKIEEAAAKNQAEQKAAYERAAPERKQESIKRNMQIHFDEEIQRAGVSALDEANVTLEEKYQSEMQAVVLLIEKEVYVALRQAAASKGTTSRAIVRAGLRLWLEANGFKIKSKEHA